jgi:hypothetical protein
MESTLIIGLLLGAIVAAELLGPMSIEAAWLRVLLIAVGGIVGALALRFFFGPAVIVLSALAGGVMVGDGVTQLWAGAPQWLCCGSFSPPSPSRAVFTSGTC